MATSTKYVAGNRTDSTRVSNVPRAQAVRPPALDDDGNHEYSDVDGNIMVGAVGDGGRGASAPYGTYASSGRTTLTSNGDGKATHMLLQQGGGRGRTYSDSDAENASDHHHRRTGPCRCCSRTCFGLWFIFVVVIIGFALAVASIVMYAFLVRDHLEQNIKQKAQQNLNSIYDQLVDNLRRAANSTNGDVSRAQLISATADYYYYRPYTTTSSTTPSSTTTTTDDSLIRLAYRAQQEAASTTTPLPSTTEILELAGVVSLAELANPPTATTTTTTTRPAAPAVGALRLPAPNPADHVGDRTSWAAKLPMADVPDPVKLA